MDWKSTRVRAAPGLFPPDLVVQVKAWACELPATHDLPLSRWSCDDLAREVCQTGLVASVSGSTIWRWLHQDAIRPWFHRSWIFPRDPDFAEKAGRLLDLYAREWDGKPLKDDEFVISADEKTSIQARRRKHPTRACRPRTRMRVEHEYWRCGAWAYIAALHVHHAIAASKNTRPYLRNDVLSKVTGLSLAQVTRLIRMYLRTGIVQTRDYRRHRFASQYSADDIARLAEVDRWHERRSGPATVCILKREYQEFGKAEFERLAGVSVSHLYNLRASTRYRQQAAVFEPTRPSPVSIGERRKPDPQGRPGFLRVDTVHQGESATL